MEKLIYGLHHAAIKCSGFEEYEKVIKFYTEVLGLEVKRKWGDGCMLDTGCGLIEFFAEGKENTCNGSVNHIALTVKDTDACIETVRKAGYEITVEPKNVDIPAEPEVFPIRIGFCVGPAGESIEFFCER